MIKIEHISKSFENTKVLDDLSLTIEEGTIFGLIGINGAGKSTLLRCIADVLKVDTGTITLNGICVKDEPEVKKDILFISDDPYFPAASTISSLKSFYSTFYDLDEELYQKYLSLFGLNEKAPISSFSKGMKRQVSLLFGMAIHPKYLLLDECFDGLDPLIRLNFKRALVQLIEERKITVLISSHNLKELEDICDSYGILENGRIDTYGDLLTSKENINKYQLAYQNEKTKEDFKDFEILDYKQEGRIVSLVIKGDKEKITSELEKTSPLILDVLPVNFEEMFIYEMENRHE